jgi:hypothetical protein
MTSSHPLLAPCQWFARFAGPLDHRSSPRLVLLFLDYALNNVAAEVSLIELVRVQFTRHRIEEVLGAAKGEAGLAHYELRSWLGWYYHMTCRCRRCGSSAPSRGGSVGENAVDIRADFRRGDALQWRRRVAGFAIGTWRP